MSDWQECKLGNVAKVQTGPFGSQLHQSDYKFTGTPIITVEHIGDNRIIHSDLPLVGEEDRARLIKYSLKTGDVIFSRVGSVDRCAYIHESENGWMFSGRLLRVRGEPEKVDSRFLSFYFSQESFKETIRMIAVGATMPSINTEILSNVDVLLPPLPEQRAIAGVLSSLDDKIDLLHRQNKTLEAMAETLWRKMFVEEAQAGWNEKGLDEIANFLNGLPCQKYPPNSSTEPLPVIKIKELRTGITDDSDMANSDVPTEYIVNDGDILFSWSGSLEIIIWSGGKGLLNQHLFKVTSNEYPKWFFFYWIKHHLADFRNIAEDKATTMGHIQRHHLVDAKVLITDDNSFKYLDRQISPLFEKMTLNLINVRKLMSLRNLLLPKLISGEVRVKRESA